MKLDGALVVVVGMGKSGVAALDFLRAKGARVRAVDQSAGTLGELSIEPQVEASFAGADLVVLSPGVPVEIEALDSTRARGVPVIGELELASWFLQGPIIGITGSNGKTTTTALTGHILHSSQIPSQVGGNIGTPPASMVATSAPGQWNVLELSSFQLETTNTFSVHIGAALNVTPDHLDRHKTMERYAAAKARLFVNQTANDFAVLNANDSVCQSYAKVGKGQTVWFSSTGEVSPGAYLSKGVLYLNGEELMPAAEIPLLGIHNVENTLAAACMAQIAGATVRQIRAAVQTFPGVEHRLEFVRKLDGVAWYNDSKATNVDATLKALDSFDGRLWVILGGKDKDSDYRALAEPLRAKAHAVFLVGAAAPKIEEQLRGVVPLIPCRTIEVAVREGRSRAADGDRVLLAPACASFDQFDNFEHRGREFKRLVNNLGNESHTPGTRQKQEARQK